MALQEFNGNITTDGTEQNLFNETGLSHYATWVNLHNLQNGDSVQIRVYIFDPNASTERKYIDTLISDAQSNPAFYIPWVPTSQYRVTVQRTAGTDRNITWCRKEQ